MDDRELDARLTKIEEQLEFMIEYLTDNDYKELKTPSIKNKETNINEQK